MTETFEFEHTFNAGESDWGYDSFIPLADFYDDSKGFIVNDTCIIEAKILASISEVEKIVDQAAPPVSEEVHSVDMYEDAIDELVDFKGLGKIGKSFAFP
ncbi:hypothetical protein PIB30_092028 [Stylosanthes scabra]|uniref:MATH domain-containing protein n=1 Tax=Stylosanthes scabra TaxID=79078 RepID=A0ABU6RV86_9FABA|nr:hypothetical protein [Stylosanthes scabra]